MFKMSMQAGKRSKGGISNMDLLLLAVLYLATISQGAYGDPTVPNIKAVISKEVNIPCKAYAPEAGDKVQIILWYKEHIKKAIYSYDARSPEGRHWVREEALGDRAEFISTVPEPYLRLVRVKPQDGGTYTCRVDYKKKQSIRTKATLTVIVPPGEVSIVDSKGQRPQDFKIGPYNEGSTIEVTCLVFEGKPAPTVKWWRHSELLDSEVEYANASVSSNTLKFGPLSREHQDILLVCQASNTEKELPISKSVTVDINFKPISVEIMGDRQPLTAGMEHEIICQSIGAKPAADITWWLDDVDLTSQSTMMEDKEGNVSSSVLTLVPEEDDAGKLLTCKAQSPVIKHEPLESPWKLEIFYIPKVTLYMAPEVDSSDIQERDNVTFICSIEANPEVDRINWYHEKIRLDENPEAGITMRDNKLILREVERHQAGVYSCVASNGIGSGTSQPMLLEVKYAPICSNPDEETMGAAKGDDVEMNCRVDASPGDVTFKWYFQSPNDRIALEEEDYTTQDRTSKLTYHIRTEHDYGKFLCYAENALGEQSDPCSFDIVPAGKPDNLENCTLTNQTSETLYISCIPGFDGGLDQHYVVVVQAYDNEVRGEILRNATETEQPVFVIEGLQPGASYLLAIYAENIKGRSEDSVLHGYTLPANLMNDINVITTHIFPITPILGVLIGVVGALVIVAVVVVVVMKLRSDARSKESNNGGPDANRKGSHAPLQPAKDAGDDGPDVILCRTDPQYEEVDGIPSKLKHANIYETVQCDTKENSKNSEKADCDDVEYAELTFTNGKSKNKAKNKGNKKTGVNGTIHSSEENTIYASIDHTRTAQLNSKQKPQQNHQEQKQQQQQPQPLQKQPQGKQPQQQQLLKAKPGIDHLDTAAQGDTDDVPLMDRALESSV